jgi:Domain of unknown function (DUF4214)
MQKKKFVYLFAHSRAKKITETLGWRSTRLLFAFLIFGAGGLGLVARFAPVGAAFQDAAKRVTSSAPKGKSVTRQSREAQVLSESKTNADGSIEPGQMLTDFPVHRMMAEIAEDQASRPAKTGETIRPGINKTRPDRSQLPSLPGALQAAQWPLPDKNQNAPQRINAPQTVALQFNGATGPADTGAFPPDTTGAVGPTQYFVFLNGRLRTFNKTTGVADGVVNVDSDVFFAGVMTVPGAGQSTFSTDPNVRYDRLTNRWYLNIIDATVVNSSGALAVPNRVIIAVSDAASNGVISATTTWVFYQFQGDSTRFTDYQSFGVDASALYIGGNMFNLAGSFSNTRGFIIPKAPTLTGSPLTVFTANNLLVSSVGPFAPRGVDNYDPANTGANAVGYFIGVDAFSFDRLTIRRVTNPGAVGGNPSVSANITVATPLTTSNPVLVPHLGNTQGNNGRLDGLDDRLFAAHLRNGRLWTAHNIGVDSTGAGLTAGANRNASRWYELQSLDTTPTVRQSGTVYDNTAPNDANQRSYWIPSVMVSGQGHVALGASIAGTNERINAFTTGRLASDTLGTMQNGPGGSGLAGYTTSSTAYNPPSDTGAGRGSRRWGDYSYTALDPCDDMTMWTIQEYCNGTNTYGVQVAKLLAPPPATPVSANLPLLPLGQSSVNITITGQQLSGSGFYDPGAGFCSRISATVTGGVIVNSVTYSSPTLVTLNLSTVSATAGAKNVTITNPDGQARTGNSLFSLVSPTLDTDNDGAPDYVEVVEGINPNVKDNNIFAEASMSRRLFVMQQYRDFLGREGDNGGIVNWTNTLNAGSLTRAQVVESFFNSAEFSNTVSPIVRLYFAAFNRIPDYPGLTNWVNAYRAGTPLASIAQSFATSAEFLLTYGALNNTQYVTLLYNNVLGRAPDPAGLNAWVAALNGGTTRGQVLLGFSESAEHISTSSNKVFVTMMYIGMLRRSPDTAGFNNWLNALNGGASRLTLIQGFINALEYHNRFLP